MSSVQRSRNAIADTLEDAALVIGGRRILELMVEPLQDMSQAVASGTQTFDWRTAESALYCIRSVALRCIGPHRVRNGQPSLSNETIQFT